MLDLLQALGCEVVGIHMEPHGLFPRDPEPTAENLGDLGDAVRASGASIGFAVDRVVASIRNLERLGFPPPSPAQVLLRAERPGWDQEKSHRRQELSRQYRILLMIGDDLGDFLPGVRAMPPPQRREQALAHGAFWGAGWLLLPNPVYGSWLRALGADPAAHLETPDPPLP